MIKIDSEKCIGCGLCSSTCPNVFQLNEETGKAQVISQEADDCDVNQCIADCPADAISNS